MRWASRASRRIPRIRQGIPVQTWAFPQDRIRRRLFEALSRRVLSFYIDRIGPYLVRELANVQGGVDGGMEHATAIFYGDKESLRAADRSSTSRHQWWEQRHRA